MEIIKPIEGSVTYSPTSRSSKTALVENPPKSVKNVAPQFVSLKGNMDPKTGVFVTEVRDTGTGQVTFQYPSKKAVAAYTRSSQSDSSDQAQPGQSQQQAPEQSSTGTGNVESKPQVASSASADAVTDGTKDQE